MLNRAKMLPSVTVRLSTRRAEPGIVLRPAAFNGELLFLFSLSFSSLLIGRIEDANDKALNELRRDA